MLQDLIQLDIQMNYYTICLYFLVATILLLLLLKSKLKRELGKWWNNVMDFGEIGVSGYSSKFMSFDPFVNLFFGTLAKNW